MDPPRRNAIFHVVLVCGSWRHIRCRELKYMDSSSGECTVSCYCGVCFLLPRKGSGTKKIGPLLNGTHCFMLLWGAAPGATQDVRK